MSVPAPPSSVSAPAPPWSRSLPPPAGEDVDVGVAGQRIVGLGADDVLDPDQDVALGVAADAGAGGQVDRHPGRAGVVGGGVDGDAAVQPVGPGPAAKQVGAVMAQESVGAGIPVSRSSRSVPERFSMLKYESPAAAPGGPLVPRLTPTPAVSAS